MNKHTAALLEQHFDTAFASLEGITRLRELILTLAMQGKLVEQDPKDQPASELLKDIEAEKKRLVAEGKIRKQKPLPPVSAEEMPYELPEGWEWVRLGALTSFNAGKTPASKNPVFWTGSKGSYWASISDLPQRGYLTNTARKITQKAVDEVFKHKPVPEGTLLMSFKLSIGKTAITKIPTYHNEAIISFCGLRENLKQYLLWLLEPITKTGDKKSAIKGNTLNSTSLNNLLVPVPPIPEQQRIVAKIDELMARCDALETLHQQHEEKRLHVHTAAIHQLLEPNLGGFVPSCESFDFLATHFSELYSIPKNVAELRKAILQLAVMGRLVPQNPDDPPASQLLEEIRMEKERLIAEGKIKKQKPLPAIKPEEMPYEIPEGWEWVRLAELTQLITKGSSPKWQGVKYVNEGEGILFVTSENVGTFKLILEKKKYVEEKFNQIEPRSILQKCDILMNIVGASIGRTAIFDLDVIANINQAVTIIRLFDILNHDYFLKFFNSLICLNYMFDKQVDNARPNLSMGNIAQFAIPLPPLPEQQRIVTKIDQFMSLCDQLDQRITARNEKQTELLNAVMGRV